MKEKLISHPPQKKKRYAGFAKCLRIFTACGPLCYEQLELRASLLEQGYFCSIRLLMSQTRVTCIILLGLCRLSRVFTLIWKPI